jgi:hypothetical protein
MDHPITLSITPYITILLPKPFFLGGRAKRGLPYPVDFRMEASKKIRGSPQTAEKKRVQMLQLSTRDCYTDILGNKH